MQTELRSPLTLLTPPSHSRLPVTCATRRGGISSDNAQFQRMDECSIDNIDALTQWNLQQRVNRSLKALKKRVGSWSGKQYVARMRGLPGRMVVARDSPIVGAPARGSDQSRAGRCWRPMGGGERPTANRNQSSSSHLIRKAKLCLIS